MESHSSPTPSPPSSPPASLLIETIDPRSTTAQHLEVPSHDLLRPASPASSDRTITRAVSPAASDRTITQRDFSGPAQPQGSQPPQNPRSSTIPAITDRIDFPSASLPAPPNYGQQHPFGIINSIVLRLRTGRDLNGNPNTMEPAPPARVVQRNDFNWTPPNGDPKDNVAAPAKTTTTSAAAAPVPGASSSSSRDEDLAGLGPEIEAAVLAKREYNDKFGAFRKRWTKTQFALADKAEKMRGTRFTGANELRPIVKTIGVMFALGKAVDLAAFPGKSFGEFDEEACSPEGYLCSLFPELTSRGVVLPLQWDFSLAGIMAGEKRDRLPALWAAAVAGQWETVDEMTSGVLAEAEELLGGV